LLGVGLGLLAVAGISGCVFCSRYVKDNDSWQIKDPTQFNGDLYDCALTVAICGAVSGATALAAIFISAMMAGEDTILIGIGALASAAAVACVVAEGVFYHYRKEMYASNYWNNWYRNSTSAQDYIKEAIKELYKQGVKNLNAKYTLPVEKEILKNLYDWDKAAENLGKEVKDSAGNVVILNYPDFWLNDLSTHRDITHTLRLSVVQNSVLGLFGNVDKYFIQASFGVYSVYVASLNFNSSKGMEKGLAKKVCWNKSRNDFECTTVKTGNTEGFVGVEASNSPWSLKQQMLFKNKYYPIKETADKKIYYNFKISGFPIGYYLMDYTEVKKQQDLEDSTDMLKRAQAFYYTKDTRHFKVDFAKYAEAMRKEKDKKNVEIDSNKFDWCTSKPASWKEAYEGSDYKCWENNVNPHSIPHANVDSKEGALNIAFNMLNIGKYPKFAKNYHYYIARKYIFRDDVDSVAENGFGYMIIQIVGIVFWAIGKFLGGKD